MTGTAETEAAELHEIYKLGVVQIPTNMPMIRTDQSDLIYKTEEAKYIAVVDDITERYEKGQPVLIGTTSVERSEYLSRQFEQARHPAQRAQREVPRAGGQDHRRGRPARCDHRGHQHGRSRHRRRARRQPRLPRRTAAAPGAGSTRSRPPTSTRRRGTRRLPHVKAQVAAEAKDVIAAGGLYVLGTERHESRRIDNQLRGRSGRQGDPGESALLPVAGRRADAPLQRRDARDDLTRLNLPDDVPIEAKMVARAIQSAQTQVEQQNFEIRKDVLKYDEVMNQQRKVIYAERRRILEGENLRRAGPADDRRRRHCLRRRRHRRGLLPRTGTSRSCGRALKQLYPVGIDHHDLIDSDDVGEPDELSRRGVARRADRRRRTAYAVREAEIDGIAGEGAMRQLERNVPAQRDGPQVARTPLRDGLPAEGIGLRGDGPAATRGRVRA